MLNNILSQNMPTMDIQYLLLIKKGYIYGCIIDSKLTRLIICANIDIS